MSEPNPMPKPGPVIANAIEEVQAVFPGDAALQRGIAALTEAGFDRAAISLPHAWVSPAQDTPNEGAANPDTPADQQQMRTLRSSMAGSVGALAAAGAVIATGGAALAGLAAAAAVGAGSGLAVHSASRAADDATQADRQGAADRGELILSVTTPGTDRQAVAETILRQAGATRVAAVRRVDAAIPSAAWTGR